MTITAICITANIPAINLCSSIPSRLFISVLQREIIYAGVFLWKKCSGFSKMSANIKRRIRSYTDRLYFKSAFRKRYSAIYRMQNILSQQIDGINSSCNVCREKDVSTIFFASNGSSMLNIIVKIFNNTIDSSILLFLSMNCRKNKFFVFIFCQNIIFTFIIVIIYCVR